MESQSYDIVLLPDQQLIEKAISMSQKLGALACYFTLDNKSIFPHISLYMLQLSDEGLKKALINLPEIANQTGIIEGVPKEYHYENNYIDIEFQKTKELESLQEITINKLNPIRTGLRERDKERLESAIEEEKENILKYGYRSVGKLFSPHLTFTRFENNQQSVINSLPNIQLFSGKFNKLAIFEMGDNGTCIKEVKSWELLP